MLMVPSFLNDCNHSSAILHINPLSTCDWGPVLYLIHSNKICIVISNTNVGFGHKTSITSFDCFFVWFAESLQWSVNQWPQWMTSNSYCCLFEWQWIIKCLKKDRPQTMDLKSHRHITLSAFLSKSKCSLANNSSGFTSPPWKELRYHWNIHASNPAHLILWFVQGFIDISLLFGKWYMLVYHLRFTMLGHLVNVKYK